MHVLNHFDATYLLINLKGIRHCSHACRLLDWWCLPLVLFIEQCFLVLVNATSSVANSNEKHQRIRKVNEKGSPHILFQRTFIERNLFNHFDKARLLVEHELIDLENDTSRTHISTYWTYNDCNTCTCETQFYDPIDDEPGPHELVIFQWSTDDQQHRWSDGNQCYHRINAICIRWQIKRDESQQIDHTNDNAASLQGHASAEHFSVSHVENYLYEECKTNDRMDYAIVTLSM